MRALFIMLAVGMTALLSSVVLSGPVYADQISVNTFATLGAGVGQHSPEIMLVKRGGAAFYGGIGPYGFGYGRGGFYGGFYPGGSLYLGPYSDYGFNDGEGYYTEGNKTCVWNGYEYSCYLTN